MNLCLFVAAAVQCVAAHKIQKKKNHNSWKPQKRTKYKNQLKIMKISSDIAKQEFSGSFEMINNDVEQEFSASNGTGKFNYLFFCYFNFLPIIF